MPKLSKTRAQKMAETYADKLKDVGVIEPRAADPKNVDTPEMRKRRREAVKKLRDFV